MLSYSPGEGVLKELLEGPVSLEMHLLLAPGNTIRLLKLQAAGTTPAQLVCELEADDVDTAAPYRAISYRWAVQSELIFWQ